MPQGPLQIALILLSLLASSPEANAAARWRTQGAVRVFLDCNRCDQAYLKREVTFVDYVRDRRDADVHVLVTTQLTGSGGIDFTLRFIGQGRFQGDEQSLTYSAQPAATADEIRRGFTEVFKLGLVRYVAETPLGDRLHVTYRKPPGGAAFGGASNDPWNYWVFRATAGGNTQGEQLSKGQSLRASVSANRTTDGSRVGVASSVRYRDSRFTLDDGTTVLSVTRSFDLDGIGVKSLTDHWSIGAAASASSSTFRNYDLRLRASPGIEYNFFPYSQSSQRMLTLQYTIGIDAHRYRAETIFGKLRENLIGHRGELGLSLRQPWGTASAQARFSQYLSDPSKYSAGASGSADVRLFRGFSFNVFGEVSRTKDQLYLPRGNATAEEILLQQRQRATSYSYYINFGVSYSFGSIFNNIVNPRFGGSGSFSF